MQTFRPNLKWYETETNAFVTVDHRDVKGEKVNFEKQKVTIEFPEGEKNFKQELELREEIDVDQSKYVVQGFSIKIDLVKAKKGFWRQLTQKDKNYKNLKVDWVNFIDPDDEPEKDPMANMQMPPGMGGMGGMPGMPGMGGMGGMPGMPGMGGMGGMPGMPGMPDLSKMNLPAEENDDSDDEDDTKEAKETKLDDLEGTD